MSEVTRLYPKTEGFDFCNQVELYAIKCTVRIRTASTPSHMMSLPDPEPLILSLLAATFCLLITFANEFDQDQDPPKPFDNLIVILKEFFEKVNFENSPQTTTKA